MCGVGWGAGEFVVQLWLWLWVGLCCVGLTGFGGEQCAGTGIGNGVGCL